MIKSFNLADFFDHMRNCTTVIAKTWPFIKKNKLWAGYLENKWVVILTLIISVLFTYFVINDLIDYDYQYFLDSLSFGSPEGKLSDHMKSAGKGQAISSGSKYLLIILLEIIIFHFSVKAVNALTGGNHKPDFKQFYKAEIRMIKLMIINFVKGVIAHGIINAGLHILGFSSLSPIIMFFVYGYFIGYAFFDNYNEQYEKTIKESQYIVRKHFGASVGLGVFISVMLYIPLVGPIFAPIFGGITASIYGYRYQIQDDVTIVEEEVSKFSY